MLRLIHYSAWCWVHPHESNLNEINWLREKLTIQVKSYNQKLHKPCYREMYLFSTRSNTFPAGLFTIVEDMALKDRVELHIKDKRAEAPPIEPLPASCSHLYAYQTEAIDAALTHRNGIIKLPTASGKTEIAIGLALRTNCRTAFLVDESSLRQQACDRWKNITGEEAGTWDNPVSNFIPVTLQTLKSRLERKDPIAIDFVDSCECIITDECHVAAARSYYRTIQSFRNTAYRIGLSATPVNRSDKKDMLVIGALGPIIYEESIEDLAEYGRLARGTIIFHDYPGWESVDETKWPAVYRSGVVFNEARNRAIVRICQVTPKPVLCFFEHVKHGYLLLQELRKTELNVDIVHGKHDIEAREDAKKALTDGNLDVLLCSRIFNKGVDIPDVRSAINAGGYKAFIMSVQKVGRTMRTAEGKTQFVFYDFVDRCHPMLLAQSRERARTFKQSLDLYVVKNLEDTMKILEERGILKEV